MCDRRSAMTVRRLPASTCALRTAALALLVLLALSCGRGGEPEPARTATAVPPARERSEAPATPAPPPTPEATAPAASSAPRAPSVVTVEGPLLVLSERVGESEDPEYRGVALRRIVIYDVAAERYWTAHEYRDARGDGGGLHAAVVRPAGTGLLVLSEGELRRVGLGGEPEAVLLTGGAVRGIMVSPDGARVAVMVGEPGTLLVLDASSGRELLRVVSDDTRLGALRGGGRDGRLELGAWRDDGEAVSVAADGGARTAVLSLGGDIGVLPRGLLLSDDLRYAIRFGEIVESGAGGGPAWESLDVVEVATGGVAWRLSDDAGIGPPPGDPPGWIPSGAPGHATFSYGGGRWILDTGAGELLTRTLELERLLGGPVRSDCGEVADSWEARPCYVAYEGRVVWEGAAGWTHYLGLVEVPGALAVEGVAPVTRVRVPPPPDPSSRRSIVGPFLLYEVRGYEGEVADGSAAAPPSPTTRLLAYDAGTRRAWTLVEDAREAQPARGGVVLRTASTPSLLYALPGGEVAELGGPGPFRVSPDGRMVAVRPAGGGGGAGRTVVLAIPSGEELLSLADEDVAAALGWTPPGESRSWDVRLAGSGSDGWTSDSGAVLIELHEVAGEDGEGAGVILMLDGSVHAVPCQAGEALSCLSPDGRYVVSGRAGESGADAGSGWRSIDVVELGGDRVPWTVESDRALARDQWEWASDDHFAWSTGLPDLERLRAGTGGADVSVLDVRTGEVEVMDASAYAARFHPPSRVAAECPEHPARACQILLDGRTVMAGRWPRIVGLVEPTPIYRESNIYRYPPVAEPPPGPFEAISVGHRGACALTPAGEAVCWGENGDGLEPVAGRYTAISTTPTYTAALTEEGEIAWWGAPERWLPDFPSGRYAAISAASGHSCALTEEGRVVCRGSSFPGEPDAGPFASISAGGHWIGNSTPGVCALTPAGEAVCASARVYLFPGRYAALSVGDFRACALTLEGEIRCEGASHPPAGSYAAVDVGDGRYETHYCALTLDGEAVCWGGFFKALPPPDPAPGRYTAVSVGTDYACALTEAGEAVCWEAQEAFVEPPDFPAAGPAGGFSAVSDGPWHTCALTVDGEAVCWGWNANGEASPPPGRYTAISAGERSTCALTDDADAVCWGRDASGALSPPPGRYAAISSGGYYACALSETGDAVCWGGGDHGLLEPPPGRYTAISAGLSHACALTATGEAVCWGDNRRGEADPPSGGRFTSISAGRFTTCAVREDGGGVCWGERGVVIEGPVIAVDSRGNCAIDATGEAVCSDRRRYGPPGPPPGRYAAISGSTLRNCALTEDGRITCWGDISYAAW